MITSAKVVKPKQERRCVECNVVISEKTLCVRFNVMPLRARVSHCAYAHIPCVAKSACDDAREYAERAVREYQEKLEAKKK